MTGALVGVMLAGRYRLSGVLGVGGSAIVYRAWDEQLHRVVAVKVLNQDSDDPASVQRHELELRTLARLAHPGLVTVYAGQAVGREPGGQPGFIVMEVVAGGSLAASLRAGPWALPRVLRLGELLADALAYIHDRGIVHRDVKPGNILLGDGDQPKLTDFGILRSVQQEAVTQPGTAIGTAAYLSPEQVLGRHVGGAADIYSLGLVLLEALTGRRSYDGPPLEAALSRLSHQPWIPADLPPAVAELLAAMTALTPAERPTAAAVSLQLRRIADVGTPATASIPPQAGVRDAPTRAVRRPRQVTAGLLAFCLAGLALEIARGGAVAAGSPPAVAVAPGVARPHAVGPSGSNPRAPLASWPASGTPSAAPTALSVTAVPPAVPVAATSSVSAPAPASARTVPAQTVPAQTVPAQTATAQTASGHPGAGPRPPRTSVVRHPAGKPGPKQRKRKPHRR